MISDSDVEFVDRRYGKNFVRLLYVKRAGTFHQIKEVEVNTALSLATTKDFVVGDNSDIIATDSQKNTVYILAKQYGIGTIEQFAVRLSTHFLDKYPHVTAARISIDEQPWKRIQQGGVDHSHAFIHSGEATRFCQVEHFRGNPPKVSAGLKNMKVMKTTKSAFVNFVRDEYRSLPDMDDRIFCTVIYSKWDYDDIKGLDFDRAWSTVKNAVSDVFAGPPTTGIFSPSVQNTLYDTQKLVLAKIPQIGQIHIDLPNVHAYEFDFSKYPAFGITKNQEVFMPVDKPSGDIQATLRRRVTAKL